MKAILFAILLFAISHQRWHEEVMEVPGNPAFYFHSAAFLLQGEHKFSCFLCRFCKISLSPSSCCVDIHTGCRDEEMQGCRDEGIEGWVHPVMKGRLGAEASSRERWGRKKEQDTMENPWSSHCCPGVREVGGCLYHVATPQPLAQHQDT